MPWKRASSSHRRGNITRTSEGGSQVLLQTAREMPFLFSTLKTVSMS
jgi:hypothetical protein